MSGLSDMMMAMEDEENFEGQEESQFGRKKQANFVSNIDEEKPYKQKRRSDEIRYFDTAQIYVKGGDGGDGVIAFRREKFVPKGGPAGGNGGNGGNVWACAVTGFNSLQNFRHKVHYRAESGCRGQGKDCHGKAGEDIVVPVPLGTIIRKSDADVGTPPLAELVNEGDRALLMAGGKGGRGNSSFKTNKNNAPVIAEKGSLGQEAWLDLELKLVADVGIIGVPNAGKSTLLSVVSAAKPKIANYPFTTLVPNLGVCEMDFVATVFADVPGLLEGAHTGLGLGHEFLRHVQRCRALVHVIDGTSPDPVYDYRAIQLELELFNPDLIDKPQVIAYNKTDMTESGEYFELTKEYLVNEMQVDPKNIFAISAVTGKGVINVVRRVRQQLEALLDVPVRLHEDALNVQEPPKTSSCFNDYSIEVDEATRTFYVLGQGIERLVEMTNWDYFQAICRFQRVLYLTRINSKLVRSGIQEGDTVVIGQYEFSWSTDKSQKALFQAWMDDMEERGVVISGSSQWPKQKMFPE